MRTICPTFNWPLSFSGMVKLANSTDRSVSDTICVPAVRYWPTSTLRTPSSPSNGARTSFCEMMAWVLAMPALAWSNDDWA